MNESNPFQWFSINDMCRICLKTTKRLSQMLDEHKDLYRSIVDEVLLEEYNMKSCSICHWMLTKFSKFKDECQYANNLLKEVVYMDSKSQFCLQNITSGNNLTTTNLGTYFYNPLCLANDTIKNDDTNDDQDILRNRLISDYSKVTAEIDTINNDNMKNDTLKDDTNDYDDEQSNDLLIEMDEDEIPLVLLRQNQRKNKKKSKKKKKHMNIQSKELMTEETQVKQKVQTSRREDVPTRSKKRRKELRDGFTSRMVQETNEYVVIKLTKEQVLQEMEERAKSESYKLSPFRCEKCVKGFNFQDVLQTHLDKHSLKNGNFECDMCGQFCRSAVSLRGHIKSHTTRYKCKLCGHVRLSRQHLLEHHAISHTSAPLSYNCDYCDFTTNKRTVMQRHVRSHAAGEPHTCHKCGKLFKSIESLRLHTIRHDKSFRFNCDRCDASFVYQSLLRKHVLCVHERREYYCVECDVQFKTAESLRLHFKKAKRHRDASAYKHVCPECPSRFPAGAPLAVHRSAAHNTPKAHACEHCRRLYSTRDALRAHTWRVHLQKEARAVCPHCGTTFARKSTLKIHMMTHTDALQHQCHCGASFALDTALHSHVLDNHKTDGEQQHLNKVEL